MWPANGKVPSFIHDALGLCSPHGPWTIILDTNSYNLGSVSGSGISARITESIVSGVVNLHALSNINRLCGNHRFWNSVTLIS